MILTYRYRLNPTKAQHLALQDALDHSRALWNAALEERIDAFRKTGATRSYLDQCKGLTELRADSDFTVYGVKMQRWPLKKLDLAFRAFFARVRKGEKPGFPRFKGADRWRALGFTDRHSWRVRDGRLHMQGIGAISLQLHRPLPSEPRSCVVRRYGKRWFACLSVDVQSAERHAGPSVGIDMGVTHLATLSTGEHIANARHGDRHQKATRRAARALARCRRGSKRREKVKARLARMREREASARATHLHQVSAAITNRFGAVVVEGLNLKGMIRSAKGSVAAPGRNVRAKSGLNRSMSDAALGRLTEMLAYKAERAGGELIKVNPRHTSQTCAACGAIDRASRKAERFLCTGCGHQAHADTNAAINIARRGGVHVPVDLNVGLWPTRDRGNAPTWRNAPKGA